MKPEDVNPQNFKVEKILYISPDGHFAIAKGEWTEDGMNRFAMRWTGGINNPDAKGFPLAHNYPMWFQLPYDIKDMLKVLIENSNPLTL